MKDMWDKRYSSEDYAYGTAPNDFFKQVLDKYNPQGTILFAAEGEGRNAVYAASKGLKAFAFDISIEGKRKALELAKDKQVSINYEVGDFLKMDFMKCSFDVAALIYAHFPPNILSEYHKAISDLIKPGGLLILEGFSKNNLALKKEDPKIGGPDKIEMLFSVDSIKGDFPNFEIIALEEAEVNLKEGLYHNGIAKVIRFIGRKKN